MNSMIRNITFSTKYEIIIRIVLITLLLSLPMLLVFAICSHGEELRTSEMDNFIRIDYNRNDCVNYQYHGGYFFH
jgi:hypothetical protein